MRSRPALLLLLFVMLGGLLPAPAASADAAAAFDEANKLYYQEKFPEAMAAYEAFLSSNPPTANAWFNLGNAAYKSGQLGRAIMAYRLAERLTPRDSALRANLQFVRSKVYSDERSRIPLWKSTVRLATVNEWALLTMACFWAACLALAWGELKHQRHFKTAFLFVMMTLVSGTGLLASMKDRRSAEAVIVAREVTARFGPLSESQSAFQLGDGVELRVLDEKGEWLQVRDAEQRVGWVRRAEAVMLSGAPQSRLP